jgi:hypothetical protein
MMTSKHNSVDHRAISPLKISISIYAHKTHGTVIKLPNGNLIAVHLDCDAPAKCYNTARALAEQIVAAVIDYGSLGHPIVSGPNFDKHPPELVHKFIFTESARFPRKLV